MQQDAIKHMALPGLLPGVVVLHHRLGLLASLICESDEPHLQEAVLFTPLELTLLIPLLEQYPEYCPYEILLASFGGSTGEQAVERARSRLYAAMDDASAWEEVMKPLRNIMTRVRAKLEGLGLDAVAMPEVGYRLMSLRPYRNRKRRGTTSNDMHIS